MQTAATGALASSCRGMNRQPDNAKREACGPALVRRLKQEPTRKVNRLHSCSRDDEEWRKGDGSAALTYRKLPVLSLAAACLAASRPAI